MIRSHHRARSAGIAGLLTCLVLAEGCGKPDAASKTPATVVDNTISLPPAQIAVVKSQEIRTGPSLSGSLEAETQATVRAEIGGPVLQTYAEAGQQVKSGQDLVRIDESSLRDAMLSAQSAVTTAQNMVDVDQHEVERDDALLKAGAIPSRQLEQAHTALIGAQSQVADARSRLSSAQKQLEKAVVKAPFTGIVSVRSVSGGDVVSPGSALYTIINPATMRLEASVPSDALSSIRLGVPVEFTVNGYPTRRFTGHISGINPTVDPATRQVRVFVTLPNETGTLVAGLFADGRVASESRTAPLAPTSAIDETGVRPWVMRLKGGKAERVEVEVGLRDATTEMVEIKSGVVPGDTVLIGAARGMSPGTPVKVVVINDEKKN